MYEFHGWLGLAETTSEADEGGLSEAINALRRMLQDSFGPPMSSVAEIYALNGEHFLSINGLLNRPRDTEGAIEELMAFIAGRLPGSWGLVYDRNDEWSESPLVNAFRVRVLARGSVSIRTDPFLSPVHPTIED